MSNIVKFVAAGSVWSKVGESGFYAGEADYPNMAFNPLTKQPYVVYKDIVNSDKTTVMKFGN